MNWGYKIFFAFVAFLMFLGVLVYRSFQSPVNLVSPDYYQQEIAFQEQIDKISNEKALEKSVRIAHNSELGEFRIIFPLELEVVTGRLDFYRPSDATLDRSWDLHLDRQHAHKISTKSLARGLWMVQIEWQDQSKSYYKELSIYLP